jgi:hypothetical protein
VVFENHSGVLDTTPTWSWSPINPQNLVCETVAWADVTNSHLENVTETFSGNGQRKLFNLGNRPIQSLDSIVVDNARLPYPAYCYDPLTGWFSLAAAPLPGTDNVKAFYSRSTSPDLAVTNWDQSHSNYLFKNTTPSGIAAQIQTPESKIQNLSAWPNPFRTRTAISLRPATGGSELRIFDASGRCVRTIPLHSSLFTLLSSLTWDGTDQAGRTLPAGMYVCIERGSGAMVKLVRLAD